MKPIHLFLIDLLLCGAVVFLMSSCVAQGVKMADGTIVVNHAAFSHKSDAENATTDITLLGGAHIAQTWNATKPDGTEWTKYFTAYKLPLGVAKATAHSKDVVEQQTTARQANAIKPTVTTSTGVDAAGNATSVQSVVPASTAIPSIK